ncbi:kinase-like domain-containing protein [Mycena epipterygia]|nr:kinase-like domain-containing protein [Mycena epipterygia]
MSCGRIAQDRARVFFQRVESLYASLTTLPQNLAIYTRPFNGESNVTPMRPRYILELLKNYTSVWARSKFLQWSYQNPDSRVYHIISKALYMQTSGAIAVSVVLSLQDPESYKGFLACSQTEAQQLLDLLQDLLDHDSLSVVRPLLFKALLRLSRASGLHPICFPLTGVQKVGQQVAAGGFGDIWKGLLRGQSVSVKVMRLFEDSDVAAVLKEFGREAVIWRQLCHPNLLPFFGVYYLDTRLCLVSLWMENGNILKFLSKESHKIDRFSLLLLHCRACIADFGLSSITDAMTVRFTHSTVSARGGTARYQAPELFRGEKAQFCSDVYAFACVCYEILTGKVPFYELPNDVAVMFHIFDGKRPSQTNLCSGTTALDSLWELLQDCWNERPDKRPTAVQIVERLKSPLIRATTTQSTTDWNEQFSSKFRRSLQVQPLLPSVPQIERMIFGDEAAEACKECFPAQDSSDVINKKDSEGESKRRFEEEASHSDTESDLNQVRPRAKKSKPSHESL